MPPIEDVEAVAREYITAVEAGASLVHHHGVHYLDHEMQDDGRKLSTIDFEGWASLTGLIRAECNPIMQFGIASARLPEKVELMKLKPEMMSYAFNVHDEFFQPDPAYPANEMYALHPRDELLEFTRVAEEHGVKPEVESFYTGAFWNIEYVRRHGLLQDPVWTTLFFGWAGGAWTPPTADALIYMVNHLPERCLWNTSVMDPASQWNILAQAIAMGGHVRVGWEDNPYGPDGKPASNAELVRNVVDISRALGREIATPDEARAMMGLS
jgi:3-keto-5-aminohexanoate cleavage enzyme